MEGGPGGKRRKMKYCSDTWFILKLFEKDSKSMDFFGEIASGKNILIVPVIVFSESFKKLMQRGISEKLIDSFFESVDASERMEIIFIDKLIAKEAAKVSMTYSVPLIDALIASTAKLTDCDFVLTDDEHFKTLERKKYIKTKSW